MFIVVANKNMRYLLKLQKQQPMTSFSSLDKTHHTQGDQTPDNWISLKIPQHDRLTDWGLMTVLAQICLEKYVAIKKSEINEKVGNVTYWEYIQ